VYVCMYICMYVWPSIWNTGINDSYEAAARLCACEYLSLHACVMMDMYVCMYVCVCVCMCVCGMTVTWAFVT
jgi:hypothetical protein